VIFTKRITNFLALSYIGVLLVLTSCASLGISKPPTLSCDDFYTAYEEQRVAVWTCKKEAKCDLQVADIHELNRLAKNIYVCYQLKKLNEGK
jgi:hypothetical protein